MGHLEAISGKPKGWSDRAQEYTSSELKCPSVPKSHRPRHGSSKILSRPPFVALMRRHRVEGMTLRAIAAQLNGLDLRTPKGSQWYAGTFRRQWPTWPLLPLTNRVYFVPELRGISKLCQFPPQLATNVRLLPPLRRAKSTTSFLSGGWMVRRILSCAISMISSFVPCEIEPSSKSGAWKR
jgi:hypothetical protein